MPVDEINKAAHWGPQHRLVLSWAAEPRVRHEESTGGVLTALGQYLLRSERVKFILHVKAFEPGGIGDGADIAAADRWPNASSDREASLTDPGTNSLIVRTLTGMGILDAAHQKAICQSQI
ncbi:coenzyme F420 hydrogenase/dehydrogenase beta subunit N-terminal domain-containing protein [Pseudohalocynthiibacter sp. F2068]|uniref:coenzyme F420 hydrogenase/dehydrogenase beta subunit N-terminal domain-containing protein n=1 Tax=Pseudohalocynthiibacter sp. F2068 TaxID=2926418 RepID=UPI001FF17414|nr:coenzyme F420 hydrogenase/dehydrogenase beta subunit N-terminal domain-containing protein [Pseudohalocynthiibacter sp. F2068]